MKELTEKLLSTKDCELAQFVQRVIKQYLLRILYVDKEQINNFLCFLFRKT